MNDEEFLNAFFDMDVDDCMLIIQADADFNRKELERQYAPEVIQAAEKRLSLGSEIL